MNQTEFDEQIKKAAITLSVQNASFLVKIAFMCVAEAETSINFSECIDISKKFPVVKGILQKTLLELEEIELG